MDAAHVEEGRCCVIAAGRTRNARSAVRVVAVGRNAIMTHIMRLTKSTRGYEAGPILRGVFR